MSDYRWTEKHYRVESIWESLRGKTVAITWRHIDPQDEPWERYRVVDADGEWIKLQGVDQPSKVRDSMDAYKKGGPIVVRLANIEMAEIVE